MANNLQMYHRILNELCQWHAGERITRARNMAFLLVGLVQGHGIHLSQIVEQWPGLEAKQPSLEATHLDDVTAFLALFLLFASPLSG